MWRIYTERSHVHYSNTKIQPRKEDKLWIPCHGGVHCPHSHSQFEHIPPESHRAIYASHKLRRSCAGNKTPDDNSNRRTHKQEGLSSTSYITLSNGRKTTHYHLDDDHHFNCLTNIHSILFCVCGIMLQFSIFARILGHDG